MQGVLQSEVLKNQAQISNLEVTNTKVNTRHGCWRVSDSESVISLNLIWISCQLPLWVWVPQSLIELTKTTPRDASSY